ncbi:oxidoreductase [Anopheles sinensis]|uniref:Oxidoreductase n=1 Tax=Anopheles sinensis TaxID=74873 RepID=A0A084WLD0_ANOSI|nr:oxidoreductase [Anopheles sinensis]
MNCARLQKTRLVVAFRRNATTPQKPNKFLLQDNLPIATNATEGTMQAGLDKRKKSQKPNVIAACLESEKAISAAMLCRILFVGKRWKLVIRPKTKPPKN